jgi:hypothetical protein
VEVFFINSNIADVNLLEEDRRGGVRNYCSPLIRGARGVKNFKFQNNFKNDKW